MIKTRMCNSFTHPCLFFVCTGSERGSVCKITLQSPVYLTLILRKTTFGFNIDFLYSLCQINKEKEWL